MIVPIEGRIEVKDKQSFSFITDALIISKIYPSKYVAHKSFKKLTKSLEMLPGSKTMICWKNGSYSVENTYQSGYSGCSRFSELKEYSFNINEGFIQES